MAKSIPSISVILLDFDQLARSNDEVVIARFRFYCANSRKRVFPKSVFFNAYRVERNPEQITIHLLDASNPSNHRTTALYSFLAPPNFSKRPLST
jgi:hypothetical protein